MEKEEGHSRKRQQNERGMETWTHVCTWGVVFVLLMCEWASVWLVNIPGRWVNFNSIRTLMTSGARHFAEHWECRDADTVSALGEPHM